MADMTSLYAFPETTDVDGTGRERFGALGEDWEWEVAIAAARRVALGDLGGRLPAAVE
ncbi:MAG: hypothetical protein P8Q97_07060 [Myxococcota bacterium]|nr:hypothetical protein [Myxococcota bacterium]